MTGKSLPRAPTSCRRAPCCTNCFYQDINTPTPINRWFLFEKDELTRTFENETDKNVYWTD